MGAHVGVVIVRTIGRDWSLEIRLRTIPTRRTEEEDRRREGVEVIVWFGEELGAEGQEGLFVGKSMGT